MIRLRLSIPAFRAIFVAVILISTLQTLIGVVGLAGVPANPPIIALATFEICATLAFATQPARTVGAILLVLVFAIAFALSVMSGELAPRFILFAAAAIYLTAPEGPRSAPLNPAREQ